MNAVCFYLVVPFSSVDVRLFVASKGVLLLWCLEKAFSACGISGCYLGRDDITVTCVRWQACLRSCTLPWWLGSSDWPWIHGELIEGIFLLWMVCLTHPS